MSVVCAAGRATLGHTFNRDGELARAGDTLRQRLPQARGRRCHHGSHQCRGREARDDASLRQAIVLKDQQPQARPLEPRRVLRRRAAAAGLLDSFGQLLAADQGATLLRALVAREVEVGTRGRR